MIQEGGMTEETAGARRRSYDPVGTRGRLLDVAAAVFQSRGYHSTNMRDVMRDSGVTGGALPHHFPPKKDLALAVIRDRVAKAVQKTRSEERRGGEEGVSTCRSRVSPYH